jgi:ankyrin repeat protein
MKKIAIILTATLLVSCSPDIETLNEAIRDGNLAKVERIINTGLDLNSEENEILPLEWAIRTSNPLLREQLVHSVLKGGADPNQEMNNGELPIAFTARLSQYAIARELALAGASGTIDYKGDPVVFHFCRVGAWEVVYAFLEAGIDQTSSAFGQSDILAESVLSRLMTAEVVRNLVDREVFIESQSKGSYAIERLITRQAINRLDMLLSVIQPITDFPEKLWDRVVWLWEFNPEDALAAAEALVAAGYAIDSPGDFPLHAAFAYEVPEALTWFLENGADPNRLDGNGFPPERSGFSRRLYNENIGDQMVEELQSYR